MFHVYSTQGQIFSGPLEKLRNYRRVQATEESSRNARVKTGTDRAFADTLIGEYTASQKAVEKYDNMLKESGTPEVVYHAYQIMSQPVSTLPGRLTLQQVREQFDKHPFSLFPIIDDRRQVIATISRGRFYELLLDGEGRIDFGSVSIADWSKQNAAPVIAAEPVSDVRRVAEVLVTEQLAALPVTEADGRIVGIISRTDILKCLLSDPPLSIWC